MKLHWQLVIFQLQLQTTFYYSKSLTRECGFIHSETIPFIYLFYILLVLMFLLPAFWNALDNYQLCQYPGNFPSMLTLLSILYKPHSCARHLQLQASRKHLWLHLEISDLLSWFTCTHSSIGSSRGKRRRWAGGVFTCFIWKSEALPVIAQNDCDRNWPSGFLLCRHKFPQRRGLRWLC